MSLAEAIESAAGLVHTITADLYGTRVRIDYAAKPWPQDDAGQSVPPAAWPVLLECDAEKRRPAGSESLRSDQPVARHRASFQIRVPAEATITPDESFRLTDLQDGLVYDITAVTELGHGQWLLIEGSARGE